MTEPKVNFKYTQNEYPTLAIFLGSGNDFDGKAEKAIEAIHHMQRSRPDWHYTVNVTSAHRSPQRTHDFAVGMEQDNTKIVLAIGGAAFALPGVFASFAPSLPVFSLPIDGLDAYLSGTNMPPSTPVASYTINNFVGAAEMLATWMMTIVHDRDDGIGHINEIRVTSDYDKGGIAIAEKMEKELKIMQGLEKSLPVKVVRTQQHLIPNTAEISLRHDGFEYMGIMAVKEKEEVFNGFGRLDTVNKKHGDNSLPVIGSPGVATNAVLQIARLRSRFFDRKDNELAERLVEYSKNQAEKVLAADAELQKKLLQREFVPAQVRSRN